MSTNSTNASHFSIGKIEDCLVTENCSETINWDQNKYYILYLFTNGNGIQNIDFNEYEIKANRAFFISPGQIHNITSKNAKGYFITFDLDFFHSIKMSFKLYDCPFFHTSIHKPFIDIKDSEPIQYILHFSLREFTSSENFGKQSILRANLEILLLQFTRIRQQEIDKNQNLLVPNNEKLRRLELLIEEYFIEHKEVDFYAKKLNISKRHLNTIITGKTGKSISEMIQNRTIIEAKRKLLYSEKTVLEIAYELGFNDKAYFHRFFKKIIGMTPLEFRKQFPKVH